MSDFIIQDSLVVVGLCLKATVQLCSTWLEGYKQKNLHSTMLLMLLPKADKLT